MIFNPFTVHNDRPFVTRVATHGNRVDVKEVIATLSHFYFLNYMHLAKQLVICSWVLRKLLCQLLLKLKALVSLTPSLQIAVQRENAYKLFYMWVLLFCFSINESLNRVSQRLIELDQVLREELTFPISLRFDFVISLCWLLL